MLSHRYELLSRLIRQRDVIARRIPRSRVFHSVGLQMDDFAEARDSRTARKERLAAWCEHRSTTSVVRAARGHLLIQACRHGCTHAPMPDAPLPDAPQPLVVTSPLTAIAQAH